MRSFLLIILASLLGLPEQQTARIEGVVLAVDGRTPGGRARILLQKRSPDGSVDYGAFTESDGRFILKNVPRPVRALRK